MKNEPKFGDKVKVKYSQNASWRTRIFLGEHNGTYHVVDGTWEEEYHRNECYDSEIFTRMKDTTPTVTYHVYEKIENGRLSRTAYYTKAQAKENAFTKENGWCKDKKSKRKVKVGC